MSLGRLLALSGLLFLGGCLYHVRERTDEVVCALAAQPFDVQPGSTETKLPAAASLPEPAKKTEGPPVEAMDVQATAFMQPAQKATDGRPRIQLSIPPEIPGSETRPLQVPAEAEAKRRELERIYPELPPLPAEPVPRPGPDGQPYTLAALQQIAAANSPQLRQAGSDVEAARGNLIQARAYPNPTVGWNVQPSNDGSTATLQGPFIDQRIRLFGKIKLSSASAEMDVRNAELALRRARSDLATAVRNAYFAVLVAQESVRVSKALARFTDEIYRLQARLTESGFAAPYEPAALRAQAFITRLAYKQAIQTYTYSWKELVAALGLRQLPLTEVAGRVDAFIPYFDYDTIRDYALRNHTDVLTALNGMDRARYNLKQAQITPYPDVDVNVSLLKDYAVAPRQVVHTVTIGLPLPVWDQNKGAIIAAEGALLRASEEPHRVEESLTNTLATAYMGYKNNLDALEYYRKFILPDQVRYYRGVFERRQVDPSVQVSITDLVTAQQALVTSMTTYLTILGSLWTSVVNVADVLQTDDLFQLGQPLPVPPLPDLESLPAWPCCHECPPAGAATNGPCAPCSPAAAPAASMPAAPVSEESVHGR